MMVDSLEGRTLRVGVTAAPSSPGHYRGATDCSSKAFKVLELLQSQLNFTYQLISLPDPNDIGIRLENGSWTGLIGMLQRNELDVVAARVPILPLFRDVVDLSIPLGQDEWVTLQKQPPRWNSLSGLLSPFEMEVWFLVVLSVAGMIPIMFIIYRLYLKFQPDIIKDFRGKLSDYVLFVVVSLLRQDHKLRISIHSQRVLMATWWIAGILLTTFYTANLTASLARPFRERSLQHPRELSWPAYKDVRWLMTRDCHTQGLIQDDNSTSIAKMLDHDLETGRGELTDSIERAISMTKQGYVWFGPSEVLLGVLLTNYRLNQVSNKTKPCSFILTDERYLTVEYGLAFARNSSLTPHFNQALRLADQSGILEYSRRPSFTGKNPCSIEGSYTARSMRLDDFLGLLYITLIGLSIATVVFLGENIIFKLCKLWRERKISSVREISSVTALCGAIMPEISNIVQQYQMEREIEKLTQEIHKMYLTDKEIRGILQEFFIPK